MAAQLKEAPLCPSTWLMMRNSKQMFPPRNFKWPATQYTQHIEILRFFLLLCSLKKKWLPQKIRQTKQNKIEKDFLGHIFVYLSIFAWVCIRVSEDLHCLTVTLSLVFWPHLGLQLTKVFNACCGQLVFVISSFFFLPRFSFSLRFRIFLLYIFLFLFSHLFVMFLLVLYTTFSLTSKCTQTVNVHSVYVYESV